MVKLQIEPVVVPGHQVAQMMLEPTCFCHPCVFLTLNKSDQELYPIGSLWIWMSHYILCHFFGINVLALGVALATGH